MRKQKWFKTVLFSLLALVLANALHALFLYQKEYEEATITFTATSNFDSFVWLTIQPKFSDSVQKFESTKIVKETPQKFNKTISSKAGLQFLGLYWSNSDRGTLTLSDVSVTSNGKTHSFENFQKLVDYTSTNVTPKVSENKVALTSNEQANGWLMLDTSRLENISKKKRFLPFGWIANCFLFVGFLLFGRLQYQKIVKQYNNLAVSGINSYKIRIAVLYIWMGLLPFWIQISHILLAVSLAVAIVHYMQKQEAFHLGNLKKFIPLVALFALVLCVDLVFHRAEFPNDFGDYSYFLLTPFLFLGIQRTDLLKIFKVFQIFLFGYLILLSVAILERYTHLAEPYSFFRFFFETIELYWHTSYLAGLIIIALLFQLLVYRLTPFYIFCCFLTLVFLYISQARLPFFIWAILTIVITFSRIPKKRRVIYAAIVCCITIFISIYILNSKDYREKLIASVLVNDAQKTDARVQLWEAGTAIFKEHPWSGIGRSSIREELSKHLRLNSDIKNRRYNAHNQYLEFLISYGILIPVILTLVLAVPIIFRLKTATVFTIYFSLAILVESYFSRQSGVVIFSFFYCFFILYDCKSKQHTPAISQ